MDFDKKVHQKCKTLVDFEKQFIEFEKQFIKFGKSSSKQKSHQILKNIIKTKNIFSIISLILKNINQN